MQIRNLRPTNTRFILATAATFVALSLTGGVAAPADNNVRGESVTAAAYQNSRTGQWLIEVEPGTSNLRLTIRYSAEHWESNNSGWIAAEQVKGLTQAQMMSAGSAVRFQIVRDAGSFDCDGWFKEGNGSGHFAFAASPSFVSELGRRGYEAPTDDQQFSMALHDVSLALVDELKTQGYDRPPTEQLVRMGTHGVRLEYIRDMKAAGYSLKSVDMLIRMRDHGVTSAYVKEMIAAGYTQIPAEGLVKARDHGVRPDFIKALA